MNLPWSVKFVSLIVCTKYTNFQPRSVCFLQWKLQSWHSINEVNSCKEKFFWKFVTVPYFIRNAASFCALNINNKQKLLIKRIHLALKEPAIAFSSQRIRSVNWTIAHFAQVFFIKILAFSSFVIPETYWTKVSAFCLSQFVLHSHESLLLRLYWTIMTPQ